MTKIRHLVWFRNDLRVTDNPALWEATRDSNAEVIAAYCITPAQWRAHDWGTPKVSFVYAALQDLARNLETLHIPLKIITASTYKDIDKKLVTLCSNLTINKLFINAEYELNEQIRDTRITSDLKKLKVDVFRFHDQVIIPPDEPNLVTTTGKIYSVFTPFKKKWLNLANAERLRTYARPRKRDTFPIESDRLPDFSDFWRESCKDYSAEASSRYGNMLLTNFVSSRASSYSSSRDIPSIEGTSRLSPYLACGLISARQCISTVLEYNNCLLAGDQQDIQVWIGELIWRDFYRYVAFHNPNIFRHQPLQAYTANVEWRTNSEEFERWCQGKTGFPIVDAAMRQLNETAWMHNRLRMIVAMFLTKDLLIDWRWGERYFMQNLMDADFCSNNGGWQWSASTGTDAAPYFRIFNPVSQSKKFDPDGIFIKRFCPELASLNSTTVHDPEKMSRPSHYPAPVVKHNVGRNRTLEAFRRAKS